MSFALEQSPTTGDEVITNYTINFGQKKKKCCSKHSIQTDLNNPI